MKLVNPADQIQLAGGLSTSRTELIDLIKAWAAISLAFAILLGGSVFSFDFITFFMISSLSVGFGFIAHELSHKVVAQKYGCQAEFRAWDKMLILAVIMAFLGFVIAAPGAVMISGPVGKRRNGKISVAGAAANLAVAAMFLSLLFVPVKGIFFVIAQYGFLINTWLALFNMIPFWMFDGKKVLNWSKPVYYSVLGISIVFLLLNGIMFG
ncbi:metalloprotease [Candidatus Woesearchaeota archaeon]|nr:metalloprotease [Candidatus Woesearchaeota archaeon]